MGILYLPVVLILCTYTTRLQIRHIDSIRYHMEREKTATCMNDSRADASENGQTALRV